MEGLPPPKYGYERIPNAADEFESVHQAQYKRHEKNDGLSASVDPRTCEKTPRMKEVLRRKHSTAKVIAFNDILYAEISKSEMYIYDPHCQRCNKMMARTRAKHKHTKRPNLLTRVEKTKPRPQTYKLEKFESDCYIGKIWRDVRFQNQGLDIAGNSEIKITEPKTDDSKHGTCTQNASTSSLQSRVSSR